ncbi:kinase [Thraustotheca clavata]|uniref:Kinase n=1 Tax=Thraustotheca clavata TaxID=74557 RepID=A0A1V9ZXY5_9STRA|nr:kinase [Thraustotheca clavata]
MRTSILCRICEESNEILLEKCSQCGHDLPSDREKLRIIIARANLVKSAEGTSDQQSKNEIKRLKEELSRNAREIDSLNITIESLQKELNERALPRQETMQDEMALIKEEQSKIDTNMKLIGSLQTIPYIDPSQFQCDTIISTGPKYELQLGEFNGRSVVMKRLLRTMLDTKDFDRFKSYIGRLAKLNGGEGTIISLIGASNVGEKNSQIYIEYMERGDLRYFLRTTPRLSLPWKTRISIALNIAQGLKVLHGLDLIHRDLSSHHVLLNQNMVAKLTGLTSSREIDMSGMTNGVGNFRWVSPESMKENCPYSEKSDIYSFGLILIELDIHEVPYSSCLHRGRPMSDFMLMDALINATPGSVVTQHKFKDSPTWYQELALRCTDLDPEKRPSAVEIVSILQSIDSPSHLLLPPAKIGLKLSVIRAKNLLDTQIFGTQDPFCKITLGGQIVRTKYHDNGGCEPRWGEVQMFENIDPVNMTLEINILNKNWIKDGQIGKCTVPLQSTIKQLDDKSTWTHWFEVFSRGYRQGNILLKFEYQGDLARWLTEYNTTRAKYKALSGNTYQ